MKTPGPAEKIFCRCYKAIFLSVLQGNMHVLKDVETPPPLPPQGRPHLSKLLQMFENLISGRMQCANHQPNPCSADADHRRPVNPFWSL